MKGIKKFGIPISSIGDLKFGVNTRKILIIKGLRTKMKQTLEFGDPINSIRRLIENKLRFKANLTEIVQIKNQGLKCKRCQR